jgi:hypothetical protein
VDTPVKEIKVSVDFNNQPKFHLLQVTSSG